MAQEPGARHQLEYALLRAVEMGISVLSPRAAEHLGETLGSLVRSPLGVRRGVVVSNLHRAFPEADEAWIRRTAAAAYRHLGREAAAMLRFSKLNRAAVRELVRIPPATWSRLEAAFADGRGVILATGHYGNWEMGAAAIAARGIPIEAIAKGQSNPLVDARIEAARRALGVETMQMGESYRRVPRALRAGKAVGIVADQDARGTGVWVPFFGTPANTHRGPALFALRVGAPVFAAVARREPDGRYLLEGEWIDTSRSDGAFDDDVVRITAAIAAQLEQAIRDDPTQYFWFHKRWKTVPPKELPIGEAGTNLRDGRGGAMP